MDMWDNTTANAVDDIDYERTLDIVLDEEETLLENIFLEEKRKLPSIENIELAERTRLSKVCISPELIIRANKILEKSMNNGQINLEEIVDNVYAMGKTILKVMGVKDKENPAVRKGETNRRERKKIDRMKELRQWIARIGNELHRRKIGKRISVKEKQIISQLKVITGTSNISNENLINKKEEMLDELRYHKVTLEKIKERAKKIRDNKMFERNESNFYRDLNKNKEIIGEVPQVDKFVEFWADIWEDNAKTPNQPWMDDVKVFLEGKVVERSVFEITECELGKEIKKRKNWTAPGMDGIQNYWWKKFTSVWPYLVHVLTKLTDEPNRIKSWLPIGKTVLLPKTENIGIVSDYRPITCLNTIYKIYTGLLAQNMKKHTTRNEIWDEGQLGTREGTLGTVDQLLIDECIMQQVVNEKRNLAVAYYDYKKAYDMVHHDWMLRVYKWMGISDRVCNVLKVLMGLWKTRLEISVGGIKQTSRWISILKGFLQGDSYSPVGFCLTEVPVAYLLSVSQGYMMGVAGGRQKKRTHSLFIDDLKVYARDHQRLEMVNEGIVTASSDTGALYGVKKCAEVVFVKGKMVKGDGLEVLTERMRALDPDKNEVYQFLGCEQSKRIDVKRVLRRVESEMINRLQNLIYSGLSDKNLINAINSHVLPVAMYVMNMCKITDGELNELDMIVKRKLREKRIHGRLSSDERLYISRRLGGRGLRSLREIYVETKTRIACYLTLVEDDWMGEVWKYENDKEGYSIKKDVEDSWKDLGFDVVFNRGQVKLDGETLVGTWKEVKNKLIHLYKKQSTEIKVNKLKAKKLQGKSFSSLDIDSHIWLNCNIDPSKVGAIIELQERMIETRYWKKVRGLEVVTDRCRLCDKFRETVDHLLSGCEKLAGTDYMKRHNNALMVLAVEWAKITKLVPDDTKWYMTSWGMGKVLENKDYKLLWDFEFKTRKTTTSRRPDLILEDNREKSIYIIDMSCPMEENIDEKRVEKLTKYRQIAFEIREKRPGYKVRIYPIVIGSLGGGGTKTLEQINMILPNKGKVILAEMIKVVLWESESLIRKIMSGLIQE